MQKKNKVNPYTIKSREQMAKIRSLMAQDNVNLINEDRNIHIVKKALNGDVYAIIQENKEFLIKKLSDNSSKLVSESFEYIGGLANKQKNVYPTVQKAINHLNLMLISINESFGGKTNIDSDDRVEVSILLENKKTDNVVELISESIDSSETITLDEDELAIKNLLENLKNEIVYEEDDSFIYETEEINESKSVSKLFNLILEDELKEYDLTILENTILDGETVIYTIKENETLPTIISNVSEIVKKKV